MSRTAGARSEQLSTFFNLVIHGKRLVANKESAKRFFEAICAREDRAECLERLVGSTHAMEALKFGFRADHSSAYIDTSVAPVLLYMSEPSLKQICCGTLLRTLLLMIAKIATLLNAFLNSFENRALADRSTCAFAWLIYEIILLPRVDDLDSRATEIAERLTKKELLVAHSDFAVREYGHKIKKSLLLRVTSTMADNETPGGRHDNDFSNFRQIAILPTGDEIMSQQRPFLRQAEAVALEPPETRAGVHLDNQFRLLREDMLGELRQDLQAAIGKTNNKRPIMKITNMRLSGGFFGEPRKRKPFALIFRCYSGIPQLQGLPGVEQRKSYLKNNRGFLKHQAFGCLLDNGKAVAFASVEREEDGLTMDIPKLVLQIADSRHLETALLAAKVHGNLDFVLVDTPIFAYEPILKRLQEKSDFNLSEEILFLDSSQIVSKTPLPLDKVAKLIEEMKGRDIDVYLNISKSINLDKSQTNALLSGLKQALSLIQGPPGTGKSFIGALLAKSIYESCEEVILVVCYTNHALDQFLEDLMDVGIPNESIVRLGAKSTQRTAELSLFNHGRGSGLSRGTYAYMNCLQEELEDLELLIKACISEYKSTNIAHKQVLEYLEFSDEDHFFEAFSLPDDEDDMTLVGAKGKQVHHDYLIRRWVDGKDAGLFKAIVNPAHRFIWEMKAAARKDAFEQWRGILVVQTAKRIGMLVRDFNDKQAKIDELWKESTIKILKSKKVIGCTTTAAAKYSAELQSTRAGVLIVEEAGEILESHILTAISHSTKHMILVGDHKQLRPKVNNYELTVEKGEGFDLNQSLFERLVQNGYPLQTLTKQHRMPPEISTFIRELTYPDLEDASDTRNRAELRGLQDRFVFVDHKHLELEHQKMADRQDQGAKASKSNEYEAEMVLLCVRYLAQQGYGTDKIVVLTPYLGQLSLLRDQLSKENDPILNDLDSFDLARAGLISQAVAAYFKRPIKISTIDNYQGEQSDIVVISLTRSNLNGDIGFMSAPERLNVLLSRARIGLIMFGNTSTFLKSKKGGQLWTKFLDLLTLKGHLYDGLPVKCERHPDRKATICNRHDFDLYCPDGGCNEPCGTILSCGQHSCPQKCHQLYDHSEMRCQHPTELVCAKNHKSKTTCHSKQTYACRKCADEDALLERQRKRDAHLDRIRTEKQRLHALKLAEIQAEMDHEKRVAKDKVEDAERIRIVKQREHDLAAVRRRAQLRDELAVLNASQASSIQNLNQQGQGTNLTQLDLKHQDESAPAISPAKVDWEHRKSSTGEQCDAIDKLMGLFGLEEIKDQFLNLKDQVDVSVRQNVDLKDERFSVSLLGNPGTGKTTVARLYAEFLVSLGALPGSHIKEETGSSLASAGVKGCQKIIEEILNKDGGALFIDEAYQLTSGQSFGGGAVLDYLLTEVERLRGKVVFILAGYNKQMESFFAHNPGLQSRFPNQFQFHDYTDDELTNIFKVQLEKKFKGELTVESGITGLYTRIAARRIGKGRGREGFGNARAMENCISTIRKRQARRLREQRRNGQQPDDFTLTREDIIGPNPSGILKEHSAWKKLQNMIGLASVKESVKSLLETIQLNYERELKEEPPIEFSFNRVFIGSPGTGKTTIAKLYGQILADLGFLSSGEVVVKTPADFVGAALGESEKNTKGILAATSGKVLVIDEAYGLAGTTSGQSDPYKTAVIDTIVAEVQSTPGEDRCVLLLGYKEQMEAMFQSVNPGLTRRFPLESAFEFEDFTDDELREILELKLKEQAFKATDQGKRAALEVLIRERNKPNFGNGGAVENLLNTAKFRFQKRISAGGQDKYLLQAGDFDEDFDRGARAVTNIRMLFKGVVGCEKIVSQLEMYQNITENMKARDMDPRDQIPFNFLFKGPPGTGKTTTARKIGKVYYDMGFLATAEVVECSVTDLVGQYVGQTGPKTQTQFEKALGKVLFVDEAYRLAEGNFAKEAMDEIVDCLTKPRFAQKLIVILAGYESDINRLMSINPGLTSRFPEVIAFDGLSTTSCIELLSQLLQQKSQILDVAIFTDSTEAFRSQLTNRFDLLSNSPNWANARDIQTIYKAIFGKVLSKSKVSSSSIRLEEDVVLSELDKMIQERSQRAVEYIQTPTSNEAAAEFHEPPSRLVSTTNTTSKTVQATQVTPEDQDKESEDSIRMTSDLDPRDDGVPNDVWDELQRDKQAMELQATILKDLLNAESSINAELKTIEQKEILLKEKAAAEADDEAKRRFEEERIRHELERQAKEKELADMNEKRERKEAERKREAATQRKLRQMGVCPVGYRWIKQSTGYRCAGGSHFISNSQLETFS